MDQKNQAFDIKVRLVIVHIYYMYII